MGLGQLTLVEHALCPLDARQSLTNNLIHEARFPYTTQSQRKTARAHVYCPLGISPSDELYLWGLLALTLKQPEPSPELRATPHWCLRQMGLVD